MFAGATSSSEKRRRRGRSGGCCGVFRRQIFFVVWRSVLLAVKRVWWFVMEVRWFKPLFQAASPEKEWEKGRGKRWGFGFCRTDEKG
ncbi:hypothetical protein RDI58_013275 [Solanum bulbocastanum]|uniref:Uncharacterized protein n=1 Tax=Solanum bulbocastanum TaxID=147425 RepID=A0AAN8YDY3_SOLBU